MRHHFDRFIANSCKKNRGWAPVFHFAITAATIALCVFGIRGRTGYNPIKISQAYYCDDAFLNQLGINPAFNLLTSALDDMRKENRDLHLMPYPTAISLARQSLGITGKCDSMHVLRRYVDNSVDNVDNFPGVSGYFPTIIPEVAATFSGNKNSSSEYRWKSGSNFIKYRRLAGLLLLSTHQFACCMHISEAV